MFLIFAWGIKETQVMKAKIFKIFNFIRIITYALAIKFIFLSVLYGTLLVVAVIQYVNLLKNVDSCVILIIIGIIFGYYSFWYYIILARAFGKEHTLFKEVGSEANPGSKAEYDVNGNPIVRAVLVQQVIGVVSQQMVSNQPNISIPNVYQQPQQQIIQQKSQEKTLQQQQKHFQQPVIQDEIVDPDTSRKLVIKQNKKKNKN